MIIDLENYPDSNPFIVEKDIPVLKVLTSWSNGPVSGHYYGMNDANAMGEDHIPGVFFGVEATNKDKTRGRVTQGFHSYPEHAYIYLANLVKAHNQNFLFFPAKFHDLMFSRDRFKLKLCEFTIPAKAKMFKEFQTDKRIPARYISNEIKSGDLRNLLEEI